MDPINVTLLARYVQTIDVNDLIPFRDERGPGLYRVLAKTPAASPDEVTLMLERIASIDEHGYVTDLDSSVEVHRTH